MVAPAIIAAGVGALGSLLGGRKAAKEQRRAIAAQNAYNDPSAIRARAEAAGFNPLLFVGPGVGLQTALEQPVMGQAIANAGMALASGITDAAEQSAYQSALEEQNAELRKAVERQTLRPEVAGVYGRAQPMSVPVAPVLPGVDGAERYPTEVDVTGKVEEPAALWKGIESDGQVTWVPGGDVDIDDLLVGAGIAAWNKMKWMAADHPWARAAALAADGSKPPPAPKHPRTGDPMPGRWDWVTSSRGGPKKWLWVGE